ncbi:MAG: DUF1634 domain-containing protein [Deltaproteobacteria bacterium]|nr:DUF1634 domain-containing protein [Deltaproteobacteria bacterium]
MNEQQNQDLKPMPEQIRYANILFAGAWLGILVMMITYLMYVSGLISAHVDMTLVTQNWNKGVDEYLKITNSPHGWAWLSLISKGDYLNFIGLVLIAVLTIFCYLFLIAGYGKRKDWAFLVITISEVVVLSVAASGILGTGGH